MEDASVIATPADAPAVVRMQRERRFYSRMGLLIAAVIFTGFAPTFYLKPTGLVHFPRPAPDLGPVLMLHGLVFSAWVALFIVQTQLVAMGRRDLHRSLGMAGFVLAIMMVPLMYVVTLDEIARNSSPPFISVLGWSAVPLFPIPFYIAVVAMGWLARRRDLQSHKRYMLSLMIMLTQPAIGRLPLAPPILAGFVVLSLLVALLFIPLILWDRRSTGKIHPATMRVMAIYAAIVAGQSFFLANPDLWTAFVVHLPAVG